MTANHKSRPETTPYEQRCLDRLISRSELINIVGVSYVTVWNWMRAVLSPGAATSADALPGSSLKLPRGLLHGLSGALREIKG